MVDIDGFFCSHLTEPVDVPTEEEAGRFVKDFVPVNATLDPDVPYAMNNLTSPAIFTELKRSQDIGMRSAAKVLDERFEEFAGLFGRRYSRVMCHETEDADTVVVCMGSMSGTVKHVVNELRASGKKVGVARVATFRHPSPTRSWQRRSRARRPLPSSTVSPAWAPSARSMRRCSPACAWRSSTRTPTPSSPVSAAGTSGSRPSKMSSSVRRPSAAAGAVCEEPIWIDLKEDEVRYNA